VHHSLLSVVGTNDALGLLAWDALAGILILVAAWRLARFPRELFNYGLLSKAAWTVVVFWLDWHWGPVLLPVGAIGALWHLRRLARSQENGGPGYPPFAAGSPVDEQEVQ